MKIERTQWWTTRAFGALSACLLFGAVAAGVIWLAGVPASAGPLWALCAIQAVPASALGVLFAKLTDVRDVDGLSRNERRRLEYVIAGKTHQIAWLIGLLIAGSLALALGLYAASYRPHILLWVYAGAGGLIGLSIFFTVASYLDVRHIASFKTKVSDRSREAKARAALIAKMGSSLQS